MIAVDASLLIAHLDPHDAHHTAATAFLLAATGDSLLIHAANLAEVLVGGARTGRGPEMSHDLQALGLRVAGHDELEPLRLAELRVLTRLKLPDCCALDVAMSNDASLATFDLQLTAAALDIGVQLAL